MMTDEQKTQLTAAIESAKKEEGREWSAPGPIGALAIALGTPEWVLRRWDDHEALGGGPGLAPSVTSLRTSSRLPAPLAAFPVGVLEAVQEAWRSVPDEEQARELVRSVAAAA